MAETSALPHSYNSSPASSTREFKSYHGSSFVQARIDKFLARQATTLFARGNHALWTCSSDVAPCRVSSLSTRAYTNEIPSRGIEGRLQVSNLCSGRKVPFRGACRTWRPGSTCGSHPAVFLRWPMPHFTVPLYPFHWEVHLTERNSYLPLTTLERLVFTRLRCTALLDALAAGGESGIHSAHMEG